MTPTELNVWLILLELGYIAYLLNEIKNKRNSKFFIFFIFLRVYINDYNTKIGIFL